MNRPPRSLPSGLLAGAVAGLAAAVVMDAFQAIVASTEARLADAPATPSGVREESTTEKAARQVSEHFGHPLAGEKKAQVGHAVHYAFGIAMGAAYGITAELVPAITVGSGTVFATALLLGTDELTLPLLDLSSKPWESSPKDHLLHWASHLAYGYSLELTCSTLRRCF